MKASERPLGGFGALPPVNTYARGMRRATQNGPAENQKRQSKKNKANKSKRKTLACINRGIPKKVTFKAIICRLGIDWE